MVKKDNYIFYHFMSRFLKLVGYIWFGGKVYGKENIPQTGPCILAGNHLSKNDAYLFFAATKRPVHILGKKELFDNHFGWFFKKMHLIRVDRSKKNPEVRKEVIKLLKEGKVIGIFPEGTFHKKTLLLPFKRGATDFSLITGAPIIPFAIKSTFKFRCNPIIEFGKPIYAKDIKNNDKVKYLEDIVRKMLINLNK